MEKSHIRLMRPDSVPVLFLLQKPASAPAGAHHATGNYCIGDYIRDKAIDQAEQV
ncbi:MAG: hypothetical protein WBN85_06125 [Candidatus Macondimonas sp.]